MLIFLFAIILPIFLVPLVFLVRDIISWIKRRDYARREAEQLRQEQKEKEQIDNCLRKKFLTDNLTRQILNQICSGNYKSNRPEEIVIYTDYIRSSLHGNNYVFSFVQNGLPMLHTYWMCTSKKQYGGDPLEIMAQALNCLLDNQYYIYGRIDVDATARIPF